MENGTKTNAVKVMTFEPIDNNFRFNMIANQQISLCPTIIGKIKDVTIEKGQTIFHVIDMKVHEIVVEFISKDGYVNSELTMPYPPYIDNCFLSYDEAVEFATYVKGRVINMLKNV